VAAAASWWLLQCLLTRYVAMLCVYLCAQLPVNKLLSRLLGTDTIVYCHYDDHGHSRSPILVPIDSSYTTFY